MYSYGDLQISKDKLDRLVTKVGRGEYTTHQLIKEYQGFEVRNEGISVGQSWNAAFGNILKRYSHDHPARIREVRAKTKQSVAGGLTSASIWEVY